MSDMVRKVALAIEEARGTPRDEPSPVAWKMARAAIAAMREPTEAMENAAGLYLHDCDAPLAYDVWQQMIDAALNEKEAPPVREGL
jgi:hypothetical protein